jgi:superoxide dismutase
LEQAIENSFDSLEACRIELVTAATTEFGNGWAWLVLDAGAAQVEADYVQAATMVRRREHDDPNLRSCTAGTRMTGPRHGRMRR